MRNVNLSLDLFSMSKGMQLLAIGIICLFVLLGAYFFFFSAKVLQINGANNQELMQKTQLEEALRQEAILLNDVAHLPAIKKMLNTWENKLISPKEMPDALNQILKIGASNQLQFNLFSPQAALPEDGFNKIPIKVSVLGNYHEIANFISQVANMPWIITVTTWTITRNVKTVPTDKVDTRLSADLLMEVYYIDKK